jgi:hypothetical protein
MSIAERISQFGNVYRGRLDQEVLDYALDYINFGEWTIAFETVCDHLCDGDIPITQQEYDEILNIARELKCDLKAGRFKYLEGLIKKL